MNHNTQERIAGLRAVKYRRKSQEDKKKQILSLGTQADVCTELEEYWSVDIIQDYSETKSALTAGKRDKFTEMMERIEKDEIDVIVCWKIDRLARNMKEGGWIIDLLQSKKLKAIITKEKIYLPEDNTIITAIEMATATEYSRELSKKVNDGNAKKARNGLPNTHAVIGYLNNTHKEQGERDWRDDPERWKYIRQGCRKILDENMSPYQVFLWLRDEIKMTTPKRRTLGGRPIVKSVFYRFLKRPEIAGFFYHKDEKIIITGDEMTPILTEDEFWLIQERMGRTGQKRTTQTISPYSGYIYGDNGSVCTPDSVKRVTCDCGKAFSIKKRTTCPHCDTDVVDMKNPKFYSKQYYYNTERKRNKLGAKGVTESSADEKLLQLAEQISFDEKIIEWSKKYLHELRDKEVEDMRQVSVSQNNYFKKLEERKQRAKDAFLDGVFTQEEYQEEKRSIEKEEKQKKTQPQKADWYALADSLMTFSGEIRLVWEHGQVKEKRAILEKLQSNFMWDEKSLNVSNTKQVNVLIEYLPKVMDEINSIEQAKSLDKQGSLQDFRDTCPTLCGWGESNSRPLLGRQVFYH